MSKISFTYWSVQLSLLLSISSQIRWISSSLSLSFCLSEAQSLSHKYYTPSFSLFHSKHLSKVESNFLKVLSKVGIFHFVFCSKKRHLCNFFITFISMRTTTTTTRRIHFNDNNNKNTLISFRWAFTWQCFSKSCSSSSCASPKHQ